MTQSEQDLPDQLVIADSFDSASPPTSTMMSEMTDEQLLEYVKVGDETATAIYADRRVKKLMGDKPKADQAAAPDPNDWAAQIDKHLAGGPGKVTITIERK